MDWLKGTKKIICLDFDGVIHDFRGGWEGADVASGVPVVDPATGRTSIDWIKELLASPDLDIRIFSTRNSMHNGISTMKNWLFKHGLTPNEVKSIGFPLVKPSIHMMIDDRGHCFEGSFLPIEDILKFKPWYK